MVVCRAAGDAAFEGSTGVRAARRLAVERTIALGHEVLASDVAVVVSELVTNALLHGDGCAGIDIEPAPGGVRVSIGDNSRSSPLPGEPSDQAMTGRGLALVGRLTSRWGVAPRDHGKVVWAELTEVGKAVSPNPEDLARQLDGAQAGTERRYRVELGEVPTDFLLAAKGHVDNLAREFALIAVGAEEGITPPIPPHLEALLASVTDRFAEARLAIKEQALRAARRREARTRLVLELTADAADAGEEYLRALDELDDYCRAVRLFTLETEPDHRVFRRWYVCEIVAQVRAAAAGRPTPPAQSFERRILDELREVAETQRIADRAVRLYRLARALAVSATPESVADAVLSEGVAALKADAGGVLLARPEETRLGLPGSVGYDDLAVARLRNESRDAALPAAVALRTGQPVWLETREERDRLFPELVELEPSMEALCAVPLNVGDRTLGSLRFSFKRPRLFDQEEQLFVLALADQTAQALDRAQLQYERIDISHRLQRSLLPPELPVIPGVQLAAVYHPFGTGVDVGGDFYDAWYLGGDQWAIAIGDAAGTGPEAAALTALVRHSLRALSLSERRPEPVLRRLNTLLTAAGRDRERFCTVVFGVVTIGERITVELAGGGHPDPMLRRADGAVESIELNGALLGVLDEAAVGGRKLELEPGTALVLYTDGVIEARSRTAAFFDERGLRRVLAGVPASADSIVEIIEQAVLTHCDGAPQDDMAVVALLAEAGPPAP